MSDASNSIVQISPGALIKVKGSDDIEREAMLVSPIMINIPEGSEAEVMFLDKSYSSEYQNKG